MSEILPNYDAWLEAPYTDPEVDLDALAEDEETLRCCRKPGRYGCGYCDACEEAADAMYDAVMFDIEEREI